MSDPDIFNKANPNDPDPVPTPNTDPVPKPAEEFNQMLGMIVNKEGEQKYPNVEEALKGAAHAQSYIAKLETELAEARTTGTTSTKLEDILEAIQSKAPTPEGEPTPVVNTPTPEIDIEKVVQNALSKIQSESTQEKNIETVTSKLKELYADKASEILYGKAKDLGLSQTEINSLIKESPKAVFKLLEIDSAVNTQNLNTDINPVNTSIDYKPPSQEIPSSMGYVTSKQLSENWKAQVAKTNKRLNIT